MGWRFNRAPDVRQFASKERKSAIVGSAERGEEGRLRARPTRVPRTSLFHFDVHVAAPPWRLTPAWAVIVAALTVGGMAGGWTRATTVLLVALLADAIWGAWWRLAVTPPHPRPDNASASLPYAEPGAPWDRVSALFSPGALSGFMLTLVLLAGVTFFLTPDILWPSALALALAVLAWWLRHVAPQSLEWLVPVYLVGVPFLAGAYLFGEVTPRVGLLTLALVAGQWALKSTRWRRGGWASIALLAWLAALVGRVPHVVLGGTLVALLAALAAEEGTSAMTDLIWLLALITQALA